MRCCRWLSRISATRNTTRKFLHTATTTVHTEPQSTGENLELRRRDTVKAVTVYDLMLANYGLDRGLDDDQVAQSYDDDIPYTPAWQEKITGVKRDQIIQIAREFADTADKTRGRSMVILGAAINHWYNMDMTYRGIMNMLIMCGCVGQSGGGWAHYVGQEKLRPQTGWLPLAFGLDWHRPPRHMNSTSFFYNHSNQWRYEKLELDEILSPLADQVRLGKPEPDRLQCSFRAYGLVTVRTTTGRKPP